MKQSMFSKLLAMILILIFSFSCAQIIYASEQDHSSGSISEWFGQAAEDIGTFFEGLSGKKEEPEGNKESSLNDESSEEAQPPEDTVYDCYEGLSALAEDSYLQIRFLDVGQGDAILISCDGEHMLVDGGGACASDKIYSVLKNQNITDLKYIICTHPEEDHAGGLPAAIKAASVETAYCCTDYSDTASFSKLMKYLDEEGVPLQVPAPGTVLTLGSSAGKIIGPVQPGDKGNNNSLVLMIKYGNTSFLFTGDAENEELEELLLSGEPLDCDVLKAAHHGSADAALEDFLLAASPDYAVVSCAAYNDYGHPAEKTLDLLKQAGVILYRTDLQGDILLYSDGENIVFSVDRNDDADTYASYESLYGDWKLNKAAADEKPEEEGKAGIDTDENTDAAQQDCDYVINIDSGKFHYPDCESVDEMAEYNKWYFHGNRQEVLDMGYEPCSYCRP